VVVATQRKSSRIVPFKGKHKKKVQTNVKFSKVRVERRRGHLGVRRKVYPFVLKQGKVGRKGSCVEELEDLWVIRVVGSRK
jgi:hypothetical protein